jgi:hypothetical protein
LERRKQQNGSRAKYYDLIILVSFNVTPGSLVDGSDMFLRNTGNPPTGAQGVATQTTAVLNLTVVVT